MDALEKATDTRIYDCPEYGDAKVDQEEVIYEEAGKKLQQINVQVQSSPKRRKRATVSALGNKINILSKPNLSFQGQALFVRRGFFGIIYSHFCSHIN